MTPPTSSTESNAIDEQSPVDWHREVELFILNRGELDEQPVFYSSEFPTTDNSPESDADIETKHRIETILGASGEFCDFDPDLLETAYACLASFSESMSIPQCIESSNQKFIPGSDADSEDIFQFPFTVEDETVHFIKDHGRIMFIVRGPPGTGKNTLSRMLAHLYPTATVCCADHYYSKTFNSPERNKQSLALSHDYCHKKVENACLKNIHPIIVQNTHMKKFEMQKYVDLAAEHHYTVIMAITTDKFKATPEILAKSNTKGLGEDYFRKRLKQWENVPPILTGWFLSPDDSSNLLNELKIYLDALLSDGKFCRVLNVFEKDELLRHYKPRMLLYCVAGFGMHNTCEEIKGYYLSDKVKETYGRCRTITIQAFLVMPSDVLAVVYLDDVMKGLVTKVPENSCEDDDIDSISHALQSISLNSNVKKHNETISFDKDFSGSPKTFELKEWEDKDIINIKDCSFIHVAQSEDHVLSPWKMKVLLEKHLRSVADSDGKISNDKFGEFESDLKICRLSTDSWLVRPPSKISVTTIFTGLYI